MSPEILRNHLNQTNSCDLARPVAISSGALRTEAKGRCTLRLRAATRRWSRRCSPRAPPSRRRATTVPAPRDGTDVTGGTWWDGGSTGEMWQRCDTPLSLLPVLRNFQCTLRDSMLRSQLPVYSSCKFVLRDVAGMSHLTILFGVVRDEIRWCLQCVIVSGLDCSVLL